MHLGCEDTLTRTRRREPKRAQQLWRFGTALVEVFLQHVIYKQIPYHTHIYMYISWRYSVDMHMHYVSEQPRREDRWALTKEWWWFQCRGITHKENTWKGNQQHAWRRVCYRDRSYSQRMGTRHDRVQQELCHFKGQSAEEWNSWSWWMETAVERILQVQSKEPWNCWSRSNRWNWGLVFVWFLYISIRPKCPVLRSSRPSQDTDHDLLNFNLSADGAMRLFVSNLLAGLI